ncbi:hypothetical protein SAMN05878437_0441 [Vreelandella subglaciescola]|uniref:Uncharacterized protein n=1 Tax=Vreelandella subglaciescola TaxID=29571 RepID=A0A1M7EUM4_9GAMM|nr:hypothetical protein SAMN05878437_0441 [Halomonas subglaciescola]
MMDVPFGSYGMCAGLCWDNACGCLNKRSTKVEAGS